MAHSSEHPPLHTTVVPVRWSDFDRFGHLNNLAYIELAHEARGIFAMEEFIGRGLDMPAVFIRRVEADYLKPILPDTQSVTVTTEVTQVGRTSFTTTQSIIDPQGSTCCVVTCVQIFVDLATASPREITSHEVKILTRGSSEASSEGDAATGRTGDEK